MEFWTWVRAEMQARGLTATECAERAGMTQSGWSRYLNEPSQDPRRSTLRRVAKGLGMPYEEVLRMAGKRPVMATDDEKVKLGERIRTFRMQAGWTQERLSDTLGIGRTTLTQYETGALEPPSLALKRIADALGVSVGSFFSTESVPARKGEQVIVPSLLLDSLKRQLETSNELMVKFLEETDVRKDEKEPAL